MKREKKEKVFHDLDENMSITYRDASVKNIIGFDKRNTKSIKSITIKKNSL